MIKFLEVEDLYKTEYLVPLKLVYVSTSYSFGERTYHVNFSGEKIQVSYETYEMVKDILEPNDENTTSIKYGK